MKTLAEFKRQLTIGSVWEAVYVPNGVSLGTREVVQTRSNAVAFKSDIAEGGLSWLNFPLARYYKFVDGEALIYSAYDDRLLLKYKKVA